MADQLTEKIIAAAIEVHKTLGFGLLESIYEEALCIDWVQWKLVFSGSWRLMCCIRGTRSKVNVLICWSQMKSSWK